MRINIIFKVILSLTGPNKFWRYLKQTEILQIMWSLERALLEQGMWAWTCNFLSYFSGYGKELRSKARLWHIVWCSTSLRALRSLCHPFISWDTTWISTVLLKTSLHIFSGDFFFFSSVFTCFILVTQQKIFLIEGHSSHHTSDRDNAKGDSME